MTLDPEILTTARAARVRMVDAQHELEHARADFHHAVGRLHAAGASMREIAAELDLSHQRVHQIVSGGEDDTVGPVRIPLPPHGGDRFFFKRVIEEEQP